MGPNGGFLVRTDTGKIVRETDIVKKGGDQENFVVWDETSKSPKVWLSSQNRFKDDGIKNALEGEYTVTMADGSKVICKTQPLPCSKNGSTIIHRKRWLKLQRSRLIKFDRRPGCTLPPNRDASDGESGPVINRDGMPLMRRLPKCCCGHLQTIWMSLAGTIFPNRGRLLTGNSPVRDCELELSEKVTPETRKKLIGNEIHRLMGWNGFERIDKTYREMWGVPRPQVHQLLSSAPLIWRAMANDDPYPIRAAICWSGNPMVWAPNTKMVYEGLKNLELFVVLEYFKTPTAALADYIFPAADWMERPLCSTIEDSADLFLGGDRAVEPHADRRMDYDFFRALGMRLGQENDWPWETYEDVIAHRMERVGISYEQFCEDGMLFPDMRFSKQEEIRADGQLRGYATPSRRVEIYPSIFEDCGYDPLPSYRELPETPLSNPELAKKYPIILTTGGRWSPMFHSEHRVPGTGTREMHPWPIFEIHLETARDLGIRDGDWCWIETPRGRIKQRARLGFTVSPGTIIAQPSWWYPEMPAEEPWLCGVWESNVNVLTDDSPENLDPACGNWVNRGLLCKVYRCEEPEWLADRLPPEMFTDGTSGFPGVSNKKD